MEGEYMTLEARGLTVQVKFEDEGVILDVFDEDGDEITGTYQFYEDLPVERRVQEAEIE